MSEGTMNNKGRRASRIRKTGLAFAAALAVCGLAFAGCAQQKAPDAEAGTGETLELEAVEGDKWASFEPVVETLEDGRQIQKTPYASGGGGTGSGYGYPSEWPYYNTYVLNADKRGCNSCHDLKSALQTRLAGGSHPNYLSTYGSEELPWASCIACHMAYDVELENSMHAHMNSEAFTGMGGNCMSCHYVDENGDYLMWDDVKYDVMEGFTDLAAEEARVEGEWNQDELTPQDKMFVVVEPQKDFKNALVEHSDNILADYTVTFSGEFENPCTMSIQEMIDKYGTETRTQAYQCTINGVGGGLVYQAEVTGIPLDKVLADLGVKETGTVLTPFGVDGYGIQMRPDVAIDHDPLLVFEMNGEPLPDDQGYPLSIWFTDLSAGQHTRHLSEIALTDESTAVFYRGNNNLNGVFGDYYYPKTGKAINTPNMGVLTAEDGQIFPAGQPVHLEGYAHAFDETVTKLEFSLDHGATWVEVPTPNTDNTRWVYWKMDLDELEPGSYTMKMRATCVDGEGAEHQSEVLIPFMFNVR